MVHLCWGIVPSCASPLLLLLSSSSQSSIRNLMHFFALLNLCPLTFPLRVKSITFTPLLCNSYRPSVPLLHRAMFSSSSVGSASFSSLVFLPPPALGLSLKSLLCVRNRRLRSLKDVLCVSNLDSSFRNLSNSTSKREQNFHENSDSKSPEHFIAWGPEVGYEDRTDIQLELNSMAGSWLLWGQRAWLRKDLSEGVVTGQWSNFFWEFFALLSKSSTYSHKSHRLFG